MIIILDVLISFKKKYMHLKIQKKLRVAIVYHYFAHYREPIMHELMKNNDVEFTMISGKKPGINIKLIDENKSLLAIEDGGLFGGIYSVILYVFIFILYHYYAQFFNNTFNRNIVPIFILFSLFSLMWNVEGKLESALSWFFNSVFVIVTVFIFERVKIIALCNKSEKKMTHRKKKG